MPSRSARFLDFWRTAFDGRVRIGMAIFIGTFTVAQILRDVVLAPEYRNWFLLQYVPAWPWYIWTMLGLVGLLVLTLESGFRRHETAIANYRHRYKERRKEQKSAHRAQLVDIKLERVADQNKVAALAAPLPKISLRVLESFVLKPLQEHQIKCFLYVSLHNTVETRCANLRDYSLTLNISGQDYTTSNLIELDDYYLSTFDEVEVYGEVYGDPGEEYQERYTEEVERRQETLTDIRHREVLNSNVESLSMAGLVFTRTGCLLGRLKRLNCLKPKRPFMTRTASLLTLFGKTTSNEYCYQLQSNP